MGMKVLVRFYGISNILGYLMPKPLYTFIFKKIMIGKQHILSITFLNKPDFKKTKKKTVKWF